MPTIETVSQKTYLHLFEKSVNKDPVIIKDLVVTLRFLFKKPLLWKSINWYGFKTDVRFKYSP